MSNYTRKFHRAQRYRHAAHRRRRQPHPPPPIALDVFQDNRQSHKKARHGGVVSTLLSIAALCGFARRRT